jgi:acetyl-CoA carboxylase biotin carboxyl carrier protein
MAKASPFDPELVRELASLIAETDLTEIEVAKGDLRIRVARTDHGPRLGPRPSRGPAPPRPRPGERALGPK